MNQKHETLKKTITDTVFLWNKDEQIGVYTSDTAWLFDFRRILLNGKHSDLIAEIFYEEWKDKYPFQLCALEVAGIPLVVTLMRKFYEKGHTDINAFFIRKSRKKNGLLRMIEGEIKEGVGVVVVDDLINSGDSISRQVQILDRLEHKTIGAWSILRFRDMSHYKRFTNRNIIFKSIFSLNDFTDDLGSHIRNNVVLEKPQPVPRLFETKWHIGAKNPSYYWVIPKSQPVIDDKRIYFGTDDEKFWCLNQSDGSIVWEFAVGQASEKKSIFSNPVILDNTIYFGSYDGNFYALDKETGKKKWIFFDADWIGSSPAIAEDLGLVFVGLEFGLIFKRGGIVALDAATGKLVWSDYTHPALTHASPCYIKKHQQVVIGSNDGKVRLYNAKTGQKLWEFTTFGGASYDPKKGRGFSDGDIKEGIVYDVNGDYIIFGSIDGFLYILERATGKLVFQYKCDFAVWSTPCLYKDRVYFTSLDKKIRCINLEDFSLRFEIVVDGTRIFGAPVVIQDRLYVGTNGACLHEFNPDTGKRVTYFQATERITNHVVYNQETETYFLPTYANEIYALKRKAEEAQTDL